MFYKMPTINNGSRKVCTTPDRMFFTKNRIEFTLIVYRFTPISRMFQSYKDTIIKIVSV